MSSISGSNSDQEYYRKLFNRFQDEIDEQRSRSAAQDQERAQRMEENHHSALRRQQEDADRNLEETKESLNRSLASEREYNRSETQKQKENYDRMGRFYSTDGRDARSLETQLKQEVENSRQTAKAYDEKFKAAEASQKENASALNRDAESQTESLRASHREEVGKLREQLRDLTADSNDTERRKSEAIAQAVRDQENQYLLKVQHMGNEQERELDHLRAKNREVEAYYGAASTEALRQKEGYFSDVMRRQNQESHTELQRLQGQFHTQIDDLEKNRKLENAATDRANRAQLDRARENQEVSLERQAQSFRDVIDRTRKGTQSEIKQLREQLHESRTSDDTQLISPAAENTVRKSMIREYEKQFDAEKERNRRSMDEQVRASTERLHDTVKQEQNKFTTAVRDGVAERSTDRKEALNYIHEIEYEKSAALKQKEIEGERQAHNMSRDFGLSLERQKRDYEGMIEALRSDASAKLQTQRQEAEFQLRMQNREGQARQSETVRQFEKKISDQKAEYQLQIEDLKQKSQNDLRDAQRQSKLREEEVSRSYEQRIAQLEAQHKERERYLETSFQEEIDRVRRSNELLIKKKS